MPPVMSPRNHPFVYQSKSPSSPDRVYLQRLSDRCKQTFQFLEEMPVALPLRCALYEGWTEIAEQVERATSILREGTDDRSATNHRLVLRDMLPPVVDLQVYRTMTIVKEYCVQHYYEDRLRKIWKDFVTLD